jgi:hypothetical protein
MKLKKEARAHGGCRVSEKKIYIYTAYEYKYPLLSETRK